MAEPYIGEIRLVGFNFAPRGWALCAGQLLPINQNQALFSILGTTYGGDGRTTFALPDLRGRVPVHEGPDDRLGARFGAETVTLTTAHLPPHTHAVPASGQPADDRDANNRVEAVTREPSYARDGDAAFMPAAGVQLTGGGRAHDNISPVRAMYYVIALFGIFPPRN